MFRKIKFLLLAALAITISSCEEEFLDTAPTDAISASDALANETCLLYTSDAADD